MKPGSIRRTIALLLAASSTATQAQAGAVRIAEAQLARDSAALIQRIETLDNAVTQAQQRLADAQVEMLRLRLQVRQLREEMARATPQPSNGRSEEATSSSVSFAAPAQVPLEERQDALEAAVKLHEQSKVESTSKYPVRLTGLLLFNGFRNWGLADNIDLPSVALQTTPASSSGSLGASLRQTILGLDADGPKVAGARTSASVALDFFSGLGSSSYNTAAGSVRMRTASVNISWSRNSIQVGQVAPLISPLSPTSFATVAEPALAGAGNLWTWSPQLRLTHRLDLQGSGHLQVELGVWDAANASYNTGTYYRTASPSEASRQPAYEGRLSYNRNGETGVQVGVGGYYERQSYPGYKLYGAAKQLDAYAATFDWRLPVGRRLAFTGEAYRGRSLGGLGGGTYKDVIVGTSSLTGSAGLRGLNAIGGWTQAKMRFSPILEGNLSIGQDDGFASDFHALILSPTATAAQLNARNRMAIGNLIFRPKTYLILSPEYRRVWSWPIQGHAATVDVFTLAVGYQF